RGSVALSEGGRIVGFRTHEEPNRHGERTLPFIEELLAEAGWSPNTLDRLGVGIGPGSFTGLRIGIALAQGIALGIDRPVVGIGSLRAMAAAAPNHGAPTVAVLDARREEYFVAAFDESGTEILPAQSIAQQDAERVLLEKLGPGTRAVGLPTLGWASSVRAEHSDLPSAAFTALLAGQIDSASAPTIPLYVRGANAVKPNLPPSPLGAE